MFWKSLAMEDWKMILSTVDLNKIEEYKNFNIEEIFENNYELAIGGSIDIKEKYPGFYQINIVNGVPVTSNLPSFLNIEEESIDDISSWNPFININKQYSKKKYNLVFNYSADKPVVIRNVFTTNMGYTPSNIKYTFNKNCRIDLLETTESENSVFCIINREVELNSAVLNYTSLYSITNDTRIINNYFGNISNSQLNVVTYNYSGNICINNWDLNLLTRNSTADINGIIKLSESMRHGTICKIFHRERETFSSQEFRHILDDKSYAMYDGDSNISDNAVESRSSQQTKTIMLSDNARIYNKPRLNIYTGEVKASHGASVGKLDENEIFYLKQRGLPEATIRKLLINAFMNDIIDRIPSSEIREVLYDKR